MANSTGTPATGAKVSVKHLQINKSQSTMLIVTAATVVFVIFGLLATKSIISKGLYQRRVLHARRQVVDQLKSNYDNAQKLMTQYAVFAKEDPNIVGGSVSGSGNLDGQNSKIVLDALPSTYDAPALASSLEKVLTGRTVAIQTISVTDDPTSNSDKPQAQPKPKDMAFSFTGNTNYGNGYLLLQDFERSIRPFDLNTLEISGSDATLQLKVGMTTSFQPAKSLDLTVTKAVN